MQPADISIALNAAVSEEGNLNYPQLEKIVEQLIASFCSANQQERDAATAALSEKAKAILRSYAWSRAEEAVRHNSEQMIPKGLAALAIENGPLDDPRHDVVNIAVLCRSADKLGLNASLVFAEAAAFTNNPWLKEWIRSFPSRSPEQRDLKKAFFVHESFNRDGFCYERGPWTVRRKIWEYWRRALR